MAVNGTTLRNEMVEFDVTSLRMVDGGDFGDSYNYAPPRDDLLVAAPTQEEVEVVEAGLLRAKLVVRRSYDWPRRVEHDGSRRSDDTIPGTTAFVRKSAHPDVLLGLVAKHCRTA